MLKNILNQLYKNKIEKIYVTGFIDIENGIAEFYPDYTTYYILIKGRYLKLESIEQYSKLKFELVDNISFDFSYEIEDEMYKAVSSVEELILTNSLLAGNNIVKIIFYNLDESKVTCLAMEIILENGQMIFFDPTYVCGICAGGEKQKSVWLNSCDNKIIVKELVIE
ncbi:MAG: hypothetical protein K6G26_10150 [Lachnospiraceae bacterium]|nr:hypothetical protein [Lachnospiraceae bacterium]